MKKLLYITKLVLFPYIILSQGVITSTLSEEISKTNSDVFIPIIIEIHDDFDILDLKNVFYKENTPIKTRASIICDEMQKIANQTQQSIINIIESNQDNYRNLKSSWIINVIFLDAKRSLISEIVNHPNVNRID